MQALYCFAISSLLTIPAADPAPIGVGVFEVDASPPIGSPLAYVPTKVVETPLSCRGIVLLGKDQPIVLCAVDWIGIGNESHRVFREKLAAAAGTIPQRVAVQTLHQHDAPWCDFSIDEVLTSHGVSGQQFDSGFARDVMDRAAGAVTKAMAVAQPITHIGLGRGQIEQVASNRRILGPDGRVQFGRMTATKDAKVRAFPEGVIDPELKMIGFWNGDRPIVALSYYATHPQSYYRTGKATPDYPGLARNQRQHATGVPHIHFNGAGGNIGAGKYNDGDPSMRPILADRVAAGMTKAWESIEKRPIAHSDVQWRSISVQLPVAKHLNEKDLLVKIADEKKPVAKRVLDAGGLVFLRRSQAGIKTDLSCLEIGSARILSMPGELFVEYQLAAQAMRPDLFVAMAAYGDYAPSYIGTAIAYEQGGYETQPTSSFVAPEVEPVLLKALQQLLNAPGKGPQRLGVEAAAAEVEQARKR